MDRANYFNLSYNALISTSDLLFVARLPLLAVTPLQKVILMGLVEAGKTSIRSVVFEGKDARELVDYEATVNYFRSIKSVIGTSFQIFDCGGQESFINKFIGDQAEFIFSDVKILVWAVDISNASQVSTSKFYFEQAASRLAEYSPGAKIFCLFHKIDLIAPDLRPELLQTMEHFFNPPISIETHYAGTSIYDQSIFKTIGEIIRLLISASSKAKTLTELLRDFLEQSEGFDGLSIYTPEKLPVIAEGITDKIMVPADLWLSSLPRIRKEFGTQNLLRSTLEIDDYIFVFQKVKDEFILTGAASRDTPFQFIRVKMDKLAETIKDLL